MASFTVDAIRSEKMSQIEKAESAVSQEQQSRAVQKLLAKSNEVSMKKISQEKEKMTKLQEQRLSRILFMKIERRFQAFPFLREKVPPLSGKPSLPELVETDDLQKLELDLQGAEKRFRSYLTQGSVMLESLWGDGKQMKMLPEQFRLNLKGLSQIMNSPIFLKEAEPLIVETVIEYPQFGQLGLPMRWFSCILQTMFMVHNMNSNPRFREMMQKQGMDESQLDKTCESGDEEEDVK
jgi:hypothetical protein